MPITSKVTGSAEITDGSIVNADINASAAIAISKISSSDITTAARTVLDDATVSAMLDTLGGTTATGTGAVVRATSPTLVTPILGSASATSIALGGGTTLANYVEGTFAPTVTLVGGAGNTVPVYSTNTGRYTRIGNRVISDYYFSGDGGDEGAGTGRINISLPIAASASGATTISAHGFAFNNATNMLLFANIASSASVAELFIITAIGTYASFTGADQNNTNRQFRIQLIYEV